MYGKGRVGCGCTRAYGVAMRAGTLSHTQRARLQALGLCEDAKQARWEERFTQLKALKTQQVRRHTRCQLPKWV